MNVVLRIQHVPEITAPVNHVVYVAPHTASVRSMNLIITSILHMTHTAQKLMLIQKVNMNMTNGALMTVREWWQKRISLSILISFH